MVLNTYFNPFSTSKLVNKSVFNNFSRIRIKIGIHDFEGYSKSSFHPKFGPRKFFWSASWKIFVLEFFKGRFQKLLKGWKLWFLQNFDFSQVFLGRNFNKLGSRSNYCNQRFAYLRISNKSWKSNEIVQTCFQKCADSEEFYFQQKRKKSSHDAVITVFNLAQNGTDGGRHHCPCTVLVSFLSGFHRKSFPDTGADSLFRRTLESVRCLSIVILSVSILSADRILSGISSKM